MTSTCCKKTYGGAQALKQEILKSTGKKQRGEFAWVLGKKGKIGFENSSPPSGAGENKRRLTDIVNHEIAYFGSKRWQFLLKCANRESLLSFLFGMITLW